MNSQSNDPTTPREWIATLESIRDAGTITLVTFTTNESSIQLVGDSRMLQPIYDYIGKLVTLNVKDVDDWSWRPFEEPNEPQDIE